MRIRLIAGLGLGALGIVASACSSSSNGNNNPYPDVATFCQAVAKAECQESTNCGVDETQCETYRSSQCQQGTIIVKQTPSDTLSRSYTSGNAKACIDALNGSSGAFGGGNDKIAYADLQKLIDTCEAVFAGNAGNGSHCVTKYDCTKGGEICAPTPGRTGEGTCATATQKMTGDVCADPGDTCPDSNYCSVASGTPTCVASSTERGPCQSNDECVSSDHCVNGACAPKELSGGPCTTDDDCDKTAPFCDPDVDKCTVGLGFLNGSFDCNGFLLGQNLPDGGGPVVNEGGTGANEGGTSMEAGATDAPSGG